MNSNVLVVIGLLFVFFAFVSVMITASGYGDASVLVSTCFLCCAANAFITATLIFRVEKRLSAIIEAHQALQRVSK